MEIKKFATYKGKKYPLVCTPLTKNQLYFLTENYDRFIINDVSRGSYQFYKGQPLNKKIMVNLDTKSIFAVIGSLFIVYKLFKTKKKIEKTVDSVNPFQDNTKEFFSNLDTWHTPPPKEESLDDEEEEFASA